MDIITLLKLLSTRTPADIGLKDRLKKITAAKHILVGEREGSHRCAAHWKDSQYLKEEDKALAKQPDKTFSRAGVDEDSGVWFWM